MPVSGRRACPRCGRTISGRCTHCKRGGNRRDRERRGSSSARGYGYRWQKARVQFLAAHPLCKRCLKAGQVTAATVVDHIVPHRGDWGLFWCVSNWQPLCETHHNRKTATEDTDRRPPWSRNDQP